MAVSDYSTTASANTLIGGIDVGEGCNPANLNNAIRQMMADLAAYQVWRSDNDGDGSGLDADLLGGVQGSGYARVGARTDDYMWIRENSSFPALYVTQQSTGAIVDFRQGAGDGVAVARINNDGSFQNYGGAGQIFMRDSSGNAVIEQLSVGGGFAFGSDDNTLISSGEAGATVQSNIDLTTSGEEMYFASDSSITLYTELQSGWGGRNTYSFSSGDITLFGGDLVGGFGQSVDFSTDQLLELNCHDGSGSFSSGVSVGPTHLHPKVDNVMDLGRSFLRWDDVYATNSTISTSDETQKQDIRDLNALEALVANDLRCNIKLFKWKHAVSAKGSSARLHSGIMAQTVETCFSNRGLDAGDYALFIKEEVLDDNGVGTGVYTYGVRYSELMMFILATDDSGGLF